MRTSMPRVVLLTWALGLGACGGDGESSFSPTVANVAGSYVALSFTVTSSVGTTDLLALGSTVTVALAADGTTTGRLFVPGGAEGGGDLDEDLAGTWTLAGNDTLVVTRASSSEPERVLRIVSAAPDRLVVAKS